MSAGQLNRRYQIQALPYYKICGSKLVTYFDWITIFEWCVATRCGSRNGHKKNLKKNSPFISKDDWTMCSISYVE